METEKLYELVREYAEKIVKDERVKDARDKVLLVNFIRFVFETGLCNLASDSLNHPDIVLVKGSIKEYLKNIGKGS